MQYLAAYRWPGNIRELRNLLERAAIIAGEDLIEPRASAARHHRSYPVARPVPVERRIAPMATPCSFASAPPFMTPSVL